MDHRLWNAGLGAMLAVVPFAAMGSECVVIVEAGVAEISVMSKTVQRYDVKTKAVDVIIPCDPPVKVISGPACLLVGDLTSGNARCVKEIGVGPKGATANATTSGSSGIGMFSALWDELKGRPRKVQAVKRAQGGEDVAGFPYGDILAPQGDLVIATKRVTAGPVTGFAIEDKTTRRKLAATIEAEVVRVPGRLIVAGHKYSWTAQVAGSARAGDFSVTTLADEPELAAELATAAKAPELAGNPAATAVTRAVIFYNNQFIFDAIRTMEPYAAAR